MTAGPHFLIGSAIGPKVNLHYRLLLSSALLIPLLSLCLYTVITSTAQHIQLYFRLQTLFSDHYWMDEKTSAGARFWESVGWFVLFQITLCWRQLGCVWFSQSPGSPEWGTMCTLTVMAIGFLCRQSLTCTGGHLSGSQRKLKGI